MADKIDPARLVTVKNFASTYKDGQPTHRSYIYKLIKDKKIDTVDIDGVTFVVLPEKDTPPAGPSIQ
jgi:GH35 family endo-1,4-beta-xylanase